MSSNETCSIIITRDIIPLFGFVLTWNFSYVTPVLLSIAIMYKTSGNA